jgi:hypothetical protein
MIVVKIVETVYLNGNRLVVEGSSWCMKARR